MQKWPIAKILLTWSLILFLIPLIDSFATGLREEQKSLSHFNWEILPGKGSRLYSITLNDNTSFRVYGSTFTLLNGVDSCIVYSTSLLGKIKKISFDKDEYRYTAKTGFFNTGGISPLIICSLFFLLSILLLFTKKLDNLQLSVFGPYLIFAFQMLYFFFYMTTD